MRTIVLINSSAGATARNGEGDLRDRLNAAFAEHDVIADIELVGPNEIRASARQALARVRAGEAEGIAVGGGDGTIRAAASELAGTGFPLGILPLGTLNHFAADLGIPADLEAAVGVIAEGKARPVDLGEVNGEIFLNNSSIGIYPYMVADRDRRQRLHGLGKWTAMALAFLRALRRFPLRRLRVVAEGLARPYKTPVVFVANNEYDADFLSRGRRTQLDQGQLYLYVARPRSRVALSWLAVRAAVARHADARDLDLIATTAATVTSRTSRLPVALDGEVSVLRPPLRYITRPGGLLVLAPSEAA